MGNSTAEPLLDKKISQNESDVNSKYSDRDSEGNTLTKAQQEYFKDSKARDKDGRLLKMWHGSYSEFNVFEPNQFVNEIGGATLIKGYFSTNESYSYSYGEAKA